MTITSGDRRARRLVLGVVVATFGFQVVHAMEHVLQAGYWLLHPADAPWLTPWATLGRDALARAADGHPGSGNELLHLAGNVAFLVGVVALARLRTHDDRVEPRWLRAALVIQGLHVTEHLALTLTWFATGEAVGVTTLFGVLHGTTLTTARVWSHFMLNVVATGCAVAAVAPLLTGTVRTVRGDHWTTAA